MGHRIYQLQQMPERLESDFFWYFKKTAPGKEKQGEKEKKRRLPYAEALDMERALDEFVENYPLPPSPSPSLPMPKGLLPSPPILEKEKEKEKKTWEVKRSMGVGKENTLSPKKKERRPRLDTTYGEERFTLPPPAKRPAPSPSSVHVRIYQQGNNIPLDPIRTLRDDVSVGGFFTSPTPPRPTSPTLLSTPSNLTWKITPPGGEFLRRG